MSTQVGSVDELHLAKGQVVVVRQPDSDQQTTWVSDGKGNFTNGDATLVCEAFESAVMNSNVYIPAPHHIGEVLTDGAYYYRIMGRQDDAWVMVKTDSRGTARNTSVVVGPVPIHLWVDQGAENQNTLPAFNVFYQAYRTDQAEQRLEAILAAGEVPPEVLYDVTVRVQGTKKVVPTAAQAKRMVGDAQMKVARVGPAEVVYDHEVSVPKPSRWGCACDQVNADDIREVTGGDLEGWEVVGCEPAA